LSTESGTAVVHARPGPRSILTRAGWNLADQALSSLTNAALSILIARSVDANAFGAFAVCFTIYSLALGCARSLVFEPLAVRFSDAPKAEFRAAKKSALAASTLFGIGVGLVLLALAPLQSPELRDPMIALALTLPGLMLQDALRLAFIAEGRPRAATVNDLVWGVLQLSAAAALLLTDIPSATLFVATWGAAAGVAALDGMVRAHTWPDFRTAFRWLRAHLDLSRFFVGEYLAIMGAFQVAILLVGAIGGVDDVGALRAAQVLLGPLNILMFAIVSFSIPELVRRKSEPPRRLVLYALGLSAIHFLATLIWSALLLALPDSTGRQLLGDAWEGGREVLPAMAVTMAGIGAAIGAACMLRALGAVRETFRQSLLLAPLLLVFGLVGVWQGGAQGAAIGFAIAQWIPVPLWWLRLVRTVRR
jgi:O-antigen/teichoic acid export membrane protein